MATDCLRVLAHWSFLQTYLVLGNLHTSRVRGIHGLPGNPEVPHAVEDVRIPSFPRARERELPCVPNMFENSWVN